MFLVYIPRFLYFCRFTRGIFHIYTTLFAFFLFCVVYFLQVSHPFYVFTILRGVFYIVFDLFLVLYVIFFAYIPPFLEIFLFMWGESSYAYHLFYIFLVLRGLCLINIPPNLCFFCFAWYTQQLELHAFNNSLLAFHNNLVSLIKVLSKMT